MLQQYKVHVSYATGTSKYSEVYFPRGNTVDAAVTAALYNVPLNAKIERVNVEFCSVSRGLW